MSTSKWTSYGLWKLRTELNFLEKTEAQVYEVFDRSGKFICSFYGEQQLKHYPREVYEIITIDKQRHLRELRVRIAEQEKRKKLSISKEEIDLKLKQLEEDLHQYLLKWKKEGGGTRGHAIGSMLKRMNELKKFFQNYC